MSSASGKSCFGANFSASFQTRFFKRGGKKRDRSTTTTLRKQAALTKDNTYDVLQEKKSARTGRKEEGATAMLTTRQPRNLTPSGSSDSGSSGSGQSPNSTDPGTPPAISAPLPGPPPGSRRPGYYVGADGFETKRRRISNYRKSDTGGNNATTTTTINNDFNNFSSSSFSFLCRSNEREQTCCNKERPELPYSSANNPQDNLNNLPSSTSHGTSVNNLTSPNSTKSSTSSATNNYGPTLPTITSISQDSDNSNYHRFFTTITSDEQRKRYKDDFDSDYEEYRRLFPQAAKVCERFTELGEQRQRELASGNWGKVEEIEQQIRREYSDAKRDPLYKAKIRFDYLHEKLSHLQRLVEEYDRKKLSSRSVTNNYGPTLPTITSTSKSSDYSDHHRYCTTISSDEQLKLCKAEYDSHFEEYRPIYRQFVEIQVRFFSRLAQLEEKRGRELENGNRRKSEEIEQEIKQEYNNAGRDPINIEVTKRLEYFHEKLGHLAQLINVYERKNSTGDVACAKNNTYDPLQEKEDSSFITSTSKNSYYPDYQRYFTTISSNEQRRRYKNEYDSHYEEHRILSCKVAEIRMRFATRFLQLEEKRTRELESANREKSEAILLSQEIEQQIMREYTDLEPVHTQITKRIDYLYAKCSHLARLIHEWDVTNSTGDVMQP